MKEQTNSSQKSMPAFSQAELLQMDPKDAERVFNMAPLEKKVDIVLSAPFAERQKLILLAKNAKELAQALQEEDIYWTIKGIGARDALSLIALTSQNQFQYLIDVDCWHRDRIEIDKIYAWLKLLGKCNETKVLEWLNKTDQEFLVFACKKMFEIFKIDEDLDSTEMPDSFPSFTLEGTYYFKFLSNDARLIATPLLNLLYKRNPQLFYTIIESVIWDSESLLEEDALHWRQSRIAEKGFPQLEEALGVYRYIEPEAIEALLKTGKRATLPATEADHQFSLRYPLSLEEKQFFLFSLFPLINSKEVFDRIQNDIGHLTNKIIMADCLEMREFSDLKRSLRKVVGYINIGLELLSGRKTAEASKLLADQPVALLFQVGYTQTLKLRRRIKADIRDIWLSNTKLRRNFFNTPWGETIAGLEKTRPLFFEGLDQVGALEYREFEKLKEIKATGHVLDIVDVIEKVLFDFFNIDYEFLVGSFLGETSLKDPKEIKAGAVFLTVLANHILRGETKLRPLSGQDLRKFLARVFEKKVGGPGPSYILKKALYDDAVSWIWTQYPIKETAKQPLEDFVRRALDELQEECGSLVPENKIDTRYISTLLFRKWQPTSEKL